MKIRDVACIDPKDIFRGVIVVIAPHMDDEILACGGTIASLTETANIHFVYATDGSRSPVPLFPWLGSISTDLAAIRVQEARNALKFLNIPEDNINFLDLPDGELKKHFNKLTQKLIDLFTDLEPTWVMIPFRFDRHPDHIAVNQSLHTALSKINHNQINIVEYFVYCFWRLLPGRDIHKFICSDQLMKVDITEHSDVKKKALEFYRSQTTLFFHWQDRPILPESRLKEVSKSPEFFVKYNPEFAGGKIFCRLKIWIRIVYLIEPPLKDIKDMVIAVLRKGLAFLLPE